MPDDILQPHQDNEGMDAQVDHCQSVWMAHSMHTSYKSATRPCKSTSIDFESQRDIGAEHSNLLCGPDVAIDLCTNAEEFRDATKAATVTFVNGSLTEIPKKLKKESLDFKSFPIFSLSQKREGILSLKREQYAIFHGEILKSQTGASSGNSKVSFNRRGAYLPSTSEHVPPKSEALSREYQLLSQGFLPADLLINSPDDIEKDNLADSTSVCDLVKSTSNILPFGQNKGKTPLPCFPCGKHEIHQSSYNLSREHFLSNDYHGYASLSIQEKKTSRLLDHRRSGLSGLVRSFPAPLPHDPLVSRDDGLKFVRDQHQKMQNCSGTPKFVRAEFYRGSSSVPQLPCSVHDVKTMNSIDSVEESSRSHPNISQATHHFLMPKETDFSETGQLLRDHIKLKGDGEIPDFSTPIGCRTSKGSKMEATGSSTKSKEKEKLQDLKTQMSLKNESSAETNTLDINAFREDHLSGADHDLPLTSNKDPKDGQESPTSQIATASVGENAKAKWVNTTVPDKNQGTPELLVVTGQVDDWETSTSRTQSLDVEHLLAHAKEGINSKSSACGIDNFGPEPSSRWVKRLKLSTSDSADGTKSTKIGEASSHKKVNNKILTNNMEEHTVPDPYANGKAKQTLETILSHPWIKRWSHGRAASSEKRHEPMEILEPKSPNAVLEKFQKKEFPSIAAMALVGKAMGSLHPCEFSKRGPVVVWDAGRMQKSSTGRQNAE
ncbi:hypothetical protein L6164_035554 [Bauhinia variegata]|uniref:Uncharacterized protein n=1 Tax=Bauhinia variegata TaxID=167791 RepID=A0ACB9KEB7_BAUVA|nr:hypothetical protein L6164_035554 [Bauhinia variegata]